MCAKEWEYPGSIGRCMLPLTGRRCGGAVFYATVRTSHPTARTPANEAAEPNAQINDTTVIRLHLFIFSVRLCSGSRPLSLPSNLAVPTSLASKQPWCPCPSLACLMSLQAKTHGGSRCHTQSTRPAMSPG